MSPSNAQPIFATQWLARLPHLAACRPRQWTGNLHVFASPPQFDFRLDPPIWLAGPGDFLALRAISSITYLPLPWIVNHTSPWMTGGDCLLGVGMG